MTDPSAAKPPMTAAQRTALAVAAACALASPLVLKFEGWRLTTYPDPIGKLTACAGVTEGVVRDRTYSDAACRSMTQGALLKTGAAIAPCIVVEIPLTTRAAFTDFAYNVGPHAFCTSTMARKVNAGDLAGACAEFPRWIYAGGKMLPGLVARRAAERRTCEADLPVPHKVIPNV